VGPVVISALAAGGGGRRSSTAVSRCTHRHATQRRDRRRGRLRRRRWRARAREQERGRAVVRRQAAVVSGFKRRASWERPACFFHGLIGSSSAIRPRRVATAISPLQQRQEPREPILYLHGVQHALQLDSRPASFRAAPREQSQTHARPHRHAITMIFSTGRGDVHMTPIGLLSPSSSRLADALGLTDVVDPPRLRHAHFPHYSLFPAHVVTTATPTRQLAHWHIRGPLAQAAAAPNAAGDNNTTVHASLTSRYDAKRPLVLHWVGSRCHTTMLSFLSYLWASAHLSCLVLSLFSFRRDRSDVRAPPPPHVTAPPPSCQHAVHANNVARAHGACMYAWQRGSQSATLRRVPRTRSLSGARRAS
jgi:hypothetical protein